MASNIEIAQAAKMKRITEVAAKLGFSEDHTMGKLRGKTDMGQAFEGTGLLKVVGMRTE